MVCEMCGGSFDRRAPNHLYCSKRCRSRAERRKAGVVLIDYICDVCGKDFQSTHPARRRCSPECKRIAKRGYRPVRTPEQRARRQELQKIWRREHPEYRKRERERQRLRGRATRPRNAEYVRRYRETHPRVEVSGQAILLHLLPPEWADLALAIKEARQELRGMRNGSR